MTILAAMAATAVSFGRKATVFPSAGSVYTCASRAFHPMIGFVVGWAMFLEYLCQPFQNSLYAALTAQRLVPHVPFALLSALAVGFMTTLCWFGIRTTARANQVLLAMMSVVMVAFLGEAIWYILKHDHLMGLIAIQPIYDARTFSVRAIAMGTALTATTFIGFDGVSILAEEIENPRRNVLIASVLVRVCSRKCLPRYRFIWWFGFGLITAPWLILKQHSMDVAGVVGGYKLFAGFGAVLLISSMAVGLTGLLGATRLLYSMGRDNLLPRKVFGHLDAGRGNPSFNVLIAGGLAYLGALTMGWERSIEILNFGALIAFMAVNLAAVRHFGFSPGMAGKRRLLH